MVNNDFEVIAYKLLAYVDACLKADVEPNIEKARELCKCSKTYFYIVMQSLKDKDLIKCDMFRDFDGNVIAIMNLTLTLDGASYLRENSTMKRVCEFLGSAFKGVLDVAVKASAFL